MHLFFFNFRINYLQCFPIWSPWEIDRSRNNSLHESNILSSQSLRLRLAWIHTHNILRHQIKCKLEGGKRGKNYFFVNLLMERDVIIT